MPHMWVKIYTHILSLSHTHTHAHTHTCTHTHTHKYTPSFTWWSLSYPNITSLPTVTLTSTTTWFPPYTWDSTWLVGTLVLRINVTLLLLSAGQQHNPQTHFLQGGGAPPGHMTHQGYTGIPASNREQPTLPPHGYQTMAQAVLQGGESVRTRIQTLYVCNTALHGRSCVHVCKFCDSKTTLKWDVITCASNLYQDKTFLFNNLM